jgi:hypothetical protein
MSNIFGKGVVIRIKVDFCKFILLRTLSLKFSELITLISGFRILRMFSYLMSKMISESPYPNHTSGILLSRKTRNLLNQTPAILSNLKDSDIQVILRKEIVTFLFDVNAIKLGNFTLSSGNHSNFYIDLRVLQSYPLFFRKTIS